MARQIVVEREKRLAFPSFSFSAMHGREEPPKSNRRKDSEDDDGKRKGEGRRLGEANPDGQPQGPRRSRCERHGSADDSEPRGASGADCFKCCAHKEFLP